MNPCITCTKQSGAEQKLMPIADEQRQHFSSGYFERKKRTHLTAVGSSCTFRAFCASRVARAASVEHSAVPRQTRAAPVEHCGSGADSSDTFRVFCGFRASSSGHFEPAAAPGRARAAISSHLRLRARLERPYAANSGSSRARQARAAKVL